MAEDYMNDAAAPAPAPVATQKEEAAPEDNSESNSALLPIAFFGGKQLKPGDTITIKVESVEDDQVQVCPAGESDEGSESDVETAPESPEEDMMA